MANISQFNTKSPTIKRILREHRDLTLSPSTTYSASPVDSNLFLWHFTLAGPPSSPYSEGIYHGRIDLPPMYPLRPPSFRFLTPSGRFEANRDICLSISGHHEESWQPAWGIRTALVALRAFMESEARGQVGGMEMSVAERERLARESRGWVCRECGVRNEDLLSKEEEEGKENGTGKREEPVPEGFNLGYRDELGGPKASAASAPASSASSSSSSFSLVDQSSTPTPTTTTSNPDQLQPQHRPQYPPQFQPLPPPQAIPGTHPSTSRNTSRAIPSQTPAAPQPGAVPVPFPLRNPVPIPFPAGATQASDEATPPWLNKAIVGVAAMLGFMLFKKAFGIELT
jgi:ubiquitin-conjugating enzyme E2 J1